MLAPLATATIGALGFIAWGLGAPESVKVHVGPACNRHEILSAQTILGCVLLCSSDTEGTRRLGDAARVLENVLVWGLGLRV